MKCFYQVAEQPVRGGGGSFEAGGFLYQKRPPKGTQYEELRINVVIDSVKGYDNIGDGNCCNPTFPGAFIPVVKAAYNERQ